MRLKYEPYSKSISLRYEPYFGGVRLVSGASTADRNRPLQVPPVAPPVLTLLYLLLSSLGLSYSRAFS